VSAQQNGAVVRATAPDDKGKFSVTLLPDGTYTLVITAAGYQTGVITGVPVSASSGKTSVSTSTSTIALGSSTMSTLSGTVTAGTGTATAPLTSATISVSQSLSTAGTVSLAQLPVDAVSATYSLKLPSQAPVVGAYSATTLPPALSAVVSEAGRYRVTAQALAQTQSFDVDVSTGDQTQSFVFP
jgi:Carboxypeptidase regulatory-like domain